MFSSYFEDEPEEEDIFEIHGKSKILTFKKLKVIIKEKRVNKLKRGNLKQKRR